LDENLDLNELLSVMSKQYQDQPQNTTDGLKIEFGKEWVHLRGSNTEPIIRIYAESASEASANNLATKMISELEAMLHQLEN